jgi:transposase
MRYFLCLGKTDMRKGMNTLCGVVHEKMKQDVRMGSAEDGGLVLYVKRLEEGTFHLPAYDAASKSYPMEWRDLVLMVEGLHSNSDQRLRRLKALRKSP